MTFYIRPEQPEDIQAISVINCEAFGGPSEAHLVDELRADGALTVSLVALENNEIVGHISFSPMTIKSNSSTIQAIGLAPLAVKPSHQKHGIGSALIKEGIEAVRRAGESILIVLGNPDYYGRFGFKAASTHGVSWEREDCGPAFQIMELKPGALKPVKGIATYHPAFDKI
jgi:putative acetyltransferase